MTTKETSTFTAVYGGAFDPPHLGHVMVVSHLLLNHPDVEKILIVPCYQQTGKNLTFFHHRYEMCKEAFKWLPVEVSTIERELGGESITLRTVQELLKRGETNLRFVVGSDLLESCRTWDGWDELAKLAPPLPIGRAGIAPLRPGDPTPISPAMSSSIVREALQAGDYTRVWRYLPRGVLQHINDYELYKRV